MTKTSIEWADEVWNPMTGCTKVSAGCKHCYAETIAKRFWGERDFSEVQVHPERLDDPLKWRTPRRVFVNSMSDLFHKDVPDAFIDQVFVAMKMAWKHTFMILTKRPERMKNYLTRFTNGGWDRWEIIRHEAIEIYGENSSSAHTRWPLPNVWLGISVENMTTWQLRAPHLLDTPAAVRFVSCEPLLGPVHLLGSVRSEKQWYPAPMRGGMIDWVICGGESGPGARPMHPDWARGLRDQCQTANVPFFFKQWGEWTPLAEDESAERMDEINQFGANRHIWFDAYGNNTGFWDVREDNGEFWGELDDTSVCFAKVGKKRAGRMLDGRTWDERPESSTDWGGTTG